jgi:rhodanese-related sulfurtransferase
MNAISSTELRTALGERNDTIVLDVRRKPAFRESGETLAGALRRDPVEVGDWSKTLPRSSSVVVYCVHGHEVSQNAAKAFGGRYLEGGIEAWRENGGDLFVKPKDSSSRWVTRERPKIDRIACP